MALSIIDTIRIYIDYDENNPEQFMSCMRSVLSNTSHIVSVVPLSPTLISDYVTKPLDDQINYSMVLIPKLNRYRGFAIYLNNNVRLNYDINDHWSRASFKYDVHFIDGDMKNPRIAIWNCDRFPHRKLDSYALQTADSTFLLSAEWLTNVQ